MTDIFEIWYFCFVSTSNSICLLYHFCNFLRTSSKHIPARDNESKYKCQAMLWHNLFYIEKRKVKVQRSLYTRVLLLICRETLISRRNKNSFVPWFGWKTFITIHSIVSLKMLTTGKIEKKYSFHASAIKFIGQKQLD